MAMVRGWVRLPYRETGRRGPGAVASGADDTGLVDVAGANEACRGELVKRP